MVQRYMSGFCVPDGATVYVWFLCLTYPVAQARFLSYFLKNRPSYNILNADMSFFREETSASGFDVTMSIEGKDFHSLLVPTVS